MKSRLQQLLRRNNRIVMLFGILLLAVIFRFYQVDHGFIFTDEGNFLNPAKQLYETIFSHADNRGFLAWYHALMFWVALGGSLLGFTAKGILMWAAFSGLLSVLCFYAVTSILFPNKLATIATFMFAINYYTIFYQRTNLAIGYAIFFLLIALWIFLLTMSGFKFLHSSLSESLSRKVVKFRYFNMLLTGISLGMIFHIRIDTGFIFFGMLGAYSLAVIISRRKKFLVNRKKFLVNRKIFLKFILIIACIIITGALVYGLFFLLLSTLHWLDWAQTAEFYKIHLGMFYKKEATIWRPYFFIYIFKFTGLPFLCFACIGILSELYNIKKLNTNRLWLLIATVGMTAGLIIAGFKYPRAYVYIILFLAIYYGIGLNKLAELLFAENYHKKRLFMMFVLSLTLLAEALLIYPLFYKRSNYDKAVEYIANQGAGNLHGTHSWPIFELLPFKHRSFMVPDTCRVQKNYRDFAFVLKYSYDKKNVRYMILDNNITAYQKDSKMLQQFVVTYLPDVVFYNDYGDDFHVCSEAFGYQPARNLFSDKIMIYDIKNMQKIPNLPIKYYDDKTMEKIFYQRWKVRNNKRLTK